MKIQSILRELWILEFHIRDYKHAKQGQSGMITIQLALPKEMRQRWARFNILESTSAPLSPRCTKK